MLISEQEKEEILSKYYDSTSKQVENYLKRRCPISTFKFDYMNYHFTQILIDDKLYGIKDNKKKLVNRIYDFIYEEFINLDKELIRRTIKMYLDMAMTTEHK